ncbi:inactive peptidyl-prolyl cis-trans isomerase FKBP6 [Ischnura elegans]|uniref:inactive peptidyl-prolyl cis-trans isomerase FKBP6 n=1 Tax=Ischnura elegans TaxID=197161 RepID=UPI001ED87580|nr:inactive peptidyl-prolyl cis-trans isomerase FKBP6 [Ischnura elegans]
MEKLSDATEGDSSEDECVDNVTNLVDGINLEELSQGTTFQIKPDDNFRGFNEMENTYFANEEILKHIQLDDFDELGEDGGPCVPGETPFETYAAKMRDVTADGGVKKKILRFGEKNGPKVPEGALVTVHYNAYNEFIEEPFDSTYMRTGPQKYRLGNGSLIPGLEEAIKSMCRNERSWFLIKPHLAYGKLGCPPRILPDATVLFDVQLMDFIDSGGAANFDSLTHEEQSKADFPVVLSAAQGFHRQGTDLFKSKVYQQAAKRFKRAVQILEDCTTVKDEKDECEMNHLLLKLYVNLGVTYNLLNDPPKACIFTKKALALDPNNVKALYNRGKAYLTLSEFSEARRFLLAAKRLKPNLPEVNAELKRLEVKQQSSLNVEQRICQRMFASARKNDQENDEDKKKNPRVDVSDTFKETAEKDLKEFIEDDRKEPLTFPQGLTAAEIDFTRNTAEKLRLRVCVSAKGKLSIFKD